MVPARSRHLVEVLWISDELASSERCAIHDRPGSAAIQGTTVLPVDGHPGVILYSVSTDETWSTHQVEVHLNAGGRIRTIMLERMNGTWTVDGVARPDLVACTNVDLGWTPATNTLVLRRNPIGVGESVTATSAWLRFPELDVVASEQTYTRLSSDRVRYDSATFAAELVMTAEDVVRIYGEELWRTVAVNRP